MDANRGAIVEFSSSLSRCRQVGYITHSTAESGLDGFMRSLALELSPSGIRVNVVARGMTETDVTAHVPPRQGGAGLVPTVGADCMRGRHRRRRGTARLRRRRLPHRDVPLRIRWLTNELNQ
ncbi:SDR family NAD(P)-dependent oxidoreductase [Cellulomonas sp. SG140]|uniref:SDR family NAD(P)-dependent oxidoreductase n=1 Tax=Cellulomonas sp. SG140 TaxID=2976536 RepID=UPI00399120C3